MCEALRALVERRESVFADLGGAFVACMAARNDGDGPAAESFARQFNQLHAEYEALCDAIQALLAGAAIGVNWREHVEG